jgi:hypothetical protein
MGTTCSGKSTVISQFCDVFGSTVRTCLIGKELRARHPPEFFNGLAAMPSTEPEVREIFSQRLTAFMEDDRAGYLLCDGIPRLVSQVDFIDGEIRKATAAYNIKIECLFVLLKADPEIIRQRAYGRDSGGNLDLTLKRIESDGKLGYDTLVALLERGKHVTVSDTSNGADCNCLLRPETPFSSN